MASPTTGAPDLTPTDRAGLLRLARATLEAWLGGRPLPAPPSLGEAGACRGAFVTLESAGELRGCIGRVVPDRPLGELVRDMALGAARDDPRFPPVATAELAEIRIEISVLGPPEPLRPVVPARIRIGRDGLVIRRGRALGVLLPQVTADGGWTPEAFLAAACRKADLAPGAWREPGTEVLTFTADVFGE